MLNDAFYKIGKTLTSLGDLPYVHNSYDPEAVLLAYQERWIGDKAKIKVIEKSRRIGLSYSEALDAVLHAASKSGANVYYISFDKDMTEGFIQDCATWAKVFNEACSEIQSESIIDNEDRQIITYKIDFDSKNKIQTLASTPRKLRSKGRPKEWLIIDESGFVDDQKDLLKAAIAMTMWGGEIHIISTHNGEENPFNELVNDIRKGKKKYSLHRVTLDEALADGLYKRMCAVIGNEWSLEAEYEWREGLIADYSPNEDEELFCIPSMGGGAYLSRVLIEKNMHDVPMIRFNGTKSFNLAPEPVRRAEMQDWINDHVMPLVKGLDPLRRHVFGMDFARSGDMTDIAPLEIGEMLNETAPFLVEMHNVPHKQQEQVLFAIADNLPRFSGGAIDAGGNGSYIAESATDRYGSVIEEIKFTENWYRENMPKFKAMFEDGLIKIPRHDDIMEDLRALQIVNGVARIPKGKTDQKRQRHGDSAIAYALANYAARIEYAPFEFETIGSRTMTNDHHSITETGFGTVGGGTDTQGF